MYVAYLRTYLATIQISPLPWVRPTLGVPAWRVVGAARSGEGEKEEEEESTGAREAAGTGLDTTIPHTIAPAITRTTTAAAAVNAGLDDTPPPPSPPSPPAAAPPPHASSAIPSPSSSLVPLPLALNPPDTTRLYTDTYRHHLRNATIGVDQYYRPVIYTPMKRSIDTNYPQVTSYETKQQLQIASQEATRLTMAACSHAAGYCVEECVSLIDCSGVSIWSLVGFFTHPDVKKESALALDYFPETAGRVIILGCPRGSAVLWKLVKRLLPARTRAKFLVLGRVSGGARQKLAMEVSPDVLKRAVRFGLDPRWLGDDEKMMRSFSSSSSSSDLCLMTELDFLDAGRITALDVLAFRLETDLGCRPRWRSRMLHSHPLAWDLESGDELAWVEEEEEEEEEAWVEQHEVQAQEVQEQGEAREKKPEEEDHLGFEPGLGDREFRGTETTVTVEGEEGEEEEQEKEKREQPSSEGAKERERGEGEGEREFSSSSLSPSSSSSLSFSGTHDRRRSTTAVRSSTPAPSSRAPSPPPPPPSPAAGDRSRVLTFHVVKPEDGSVPGQHVVLMGDTRARSTTTTTRGRGRGRGGVTTTGGKRRPGGLAT